MVWNRHQGGPDVCTREMLLYLAYVACRLAKNRPRATTAVDPPEQFLEKLHAFEASEAHTEACEVPLSESFVCLLLFFLFPCLLSSAVSFFPLLVSEEP